MGRGELVGFEVSSFEQGLRRVVFERCTYVVVLRCIVVRSSILDFVFVDGGSERCVVTRLLAEICRLSQ